MIYRRHGNGLTVIIILYEWCKGYAIVEKYGVYSAFGGYELMKSFSDALQLRGIVRMICKMVKVDLKPIKEIDNFMLDIEDAFYEAEL